MLYIDVYANVICMSFAYKLHLHMCFRPAAAFLFPLRYILFFDISWFELLILFSPVFARVNQYTDLFSIWTSFNQVQTAAKAAVN